MWDTLGQILALAAGITFSPIQIIAALMLLFTPNARSLGVSFLAGWLIGLTGTTIIVTLIASAMPEPENATSRPVLAVIQIALALALLWLAWRSWGKRPAPGTEPKLPGWMASFESLNAWGTFVLALGLGSINPKILLLSAAAGASIGGAELSGAENAATIFVFVLLASSSVIAIIGTYLVAGARIQPALSRLRTWIVTENATISMVMFLIFGFVVFGNAIGNL